MWWNEVLKSPIPARGSNEAARVHQSYCRFGGRLAIRGARAAAGNAGDWIS
jgi:hypothetical protein